MKRFRLKVEAYDGKKFKKLFNREYSRLPSKQFNDLCEKFKNHEFKSLKILLFDRGQLISSERI